LRSRSLIGISFRDIGGTARCSRIIIIDKESRSCRGRPRETIDRNIVRSFASFLSLSLSLSFSPWSSLVARNKSASGRSRALAAGRDFVALHPPLAPLFAPLLVDSPRSPTPPRVLSSSSRPSALLATLHPSQSLPLSSPETARSHATRARPAGWHSVAFSAVHLRVSQSVSQSLSQSVGESGRSGTRERYHRSLLSLSLSLFFLSFSFSFPCTVCNYGLLSPLSFSLSLSSHSYLSPRSLTVFLHCASFFSSFTRSLRSRTSDRVARPMRHEFSSLLSLSPSLFPRALLRVHQPVRDVYFPRSRAARRRGVGKGRNAPTIPRDRRSVSRDEILIGGLRCLWLKIRGRSGCVLVCNTYGKSAMVRPVATTDGKNLTGRARVYTFARISRHSRRPREANSLSFSRCSERDLLLLRA